MSDLKLGTPKLYAEHVPDVTSELDANGVRQVHDLPGHVDIGVEIDGVKIRLGRKATAGLLADIERAKSAKGSGSADDGNNQSES